MKYETRAGLPVEVRAEGDVIKVAGYAAVFNERANIGGYFEEVIAPGAFSAAVGRDDVVFLINHAGLPMARTRSGTLKLTEDERGLRIESELDPEDPDVKAIVPKMKRGDLDKMSFAFYPVVEEWDERGEIPLRTIREASLVDVSIVTSPAYSGTEIGLRSLQEHRAAVQQRNSGNEQIVARLRMKLCLSEASAK